MKSMSILMLVMFFNVSLTILGVMGIFVRSETSLPTMLLGAAATGFIDLIIGLGAGIVVGALTSWFTGGGINAMSVTFFALYMGLWGTNIGMLTNNAGIPDLGWIGIFLTSLGVLLAFIGALQISTGGWQSYE